MTMPIEMSPEAQQRALRALSFMIQRGYGIMRAAREAGSSRRSIHKYMKMIGIPYRMVRGRMVILKTLPQKIYEFIIHMERGDTATRAARKAHTRIRTMARQEVDGYPIIKKVGLRWVLNAYPLYNHSLVLYGHILGLGDQIQGRYEVGRDIRSPDAPDIWWQIDFDEFISTLPDSEVGEFWKDAIIDWLRDDLQMPIVVNDVLSERFTGNDDVLDHAEEYGRIGNDGMIMVSRLENMLNRYNVRLNEYVNYGIDDNHEARGIGLISKEDLGPMQALGRFQVFFVKDEPVGYPIEGPLEMIFDYDLIEERL